MEIRFASLKDIPSIIRIARLTWPVSYKNIISDQQINYMLDLFYSPVSLLNQFEILEHKFLLLQDNDSSLKGFASFSFIPHLNGARLHKLYVLPEAQKRGFGKSLIFRVIEEVKNAKFNFVELNINRNNSALRFYMDNGFNIVKEEIIEIGEGYFMDDYIVRKNLFI